MNLPKGWESCTLSHICTRIVDGSHNPPAAKPAGEPMLSARNIEGGRIEFDQFRLISSEAFEAEHRRTQIRPGSVLLTIVGALGRSAVVQPLHGRFTVQRSVAVLHPQLGVSPDFIARRFDAADAREWFSKNARGTAQKGVYLNTLGTFALDLPPTAEQRRIVAKLDGLTARLARARAELDWTLKLATRFRRQALKRCFAENCGRVSVALGTIISAIQSGKNMRCAERPPQSGERGVVKVSAVTWGQFDPEQSKTLPVDYVPPEIARIRLGDLLISRANTLELVGSVVLVEDDPRDLFLSDKILRLVMDQDKKKWVLWFLRSMEGRRQIEALSSGNQMSMRNISQQALRQIEIPMPAKEKRDFLLATLETDFARADRLEAEAARARALLDRLEAAILARAFRGELVPQDPNDEPASVLLDRIRAQRAAVPKPKRGRRTKEAA